MPHSFIFHAAPMVADRKHHKITGNKIRMISAVSQVEADAIGFNGHLVNIGYGITGIDAQVGQDLVELGRAIFYRP